jgi:soluble lytic murein transglycosylase-like protein
MPNFALSISESPLSREVLGRRRIFMPKNTLTAVTTYGNLSKCFHSQEIPRETVWGSDLVKYIVAGLLIACLLFFATPSWAGIYRYEDERGVIYFTNCPRDSKFKLYIRDSKDDVEEPPRSNGSFKDSNLYDHLISEFSEKYQVDFAIIKAIIRAESGFNPYAVSRKGARGLMQLMPETALRLNVTNSFNPKDNIDGGVRYFKYLLYLFNDDLRLALAAYNAGENLVSQLGAIPPYRETTDYVQRVLSFYQYYKQ